MFNRGPHVNILVLATFITDFSILALMVAGVLRWRNIRGGVGSSGSYTRRQAFIALETTII